MWYIILCIPIIFSLANSTSIFLPPEKIEPVKYIKYDFQVKRIENMYIQTMTVKTYMTDAVCSLSTFEKIALCKKIFDLNHYKKDMGVHLNKIAFSLAKLTCKVKTLEFVTNLNFPKNNIQNMYPCYGRHTPVQTSFIEDNYYKKFYISAGPIENSVIVYIKEYNAENEWYRIYNYLENMEIFKLSGTEISVNEINEELNMNWFVIRTSNQQKLEYIYLRERDFMQIRDPLCDMETNRITALCEFVFNHFIYKQIEINLNKTAFYYFSPGCEKFKLKFRYSEKHKRDIIKQEMLPCYGRNTMAFGNILSDKHLFMFFISSGTRRNSLLVYLMEMKKVTDSDIKNKGSDMQLDKFNYKYSEYNVEEDKQVVYLFEMIENIRIKDFPPLEITEEDIEKESPSTKIIADQLNVYDSEIRHLKQHISELTKQKQYSKKRGLEKIEKKIKDINDDINNVIKKINDLQVDKKTKYLFVSAI